MGLKCGIIGLANIGKTTIFNCMSSTKAQTSNYAFTASKSNVGIVNVPDNRLIELSEIQPTEKIIPTTVDIVDIPGITKGSSKGEGVGNSFLNDIQQADALIHVLRCFDDVNIPHIENSVDPVRDIEIIDFELQLKDLEHIERKLEKVQRIAHSGDKDAKHAVEFIQSIKDHLEGFETVRTMEISSLDRSRYMSDVFLLTDKPIIYVCNVDEASAVNGNKMYEAVKEAVKGQDAQVIFIAGGVEADISELEDEDDRKEFLNDLGLQEPGVNKLIRAAYDLLGLQTFFTVGPKENRAWTIRKGMLAPQAAGVIHSDLERGFIRAEVIKYNDFVEYRSEQACKDAGKFNVEGKNYEVGDGDILHVRFNV